MKLTEQEKSAFQTGLRAVFGEAADALAERLQNGDGLQTAAFGDGEVMYDDRHAMSALAFVIDGGAEVVRTREGCEVFLRSMGRGDVFGAALLFAESESYVTVVRAKGKTRVLFLPQSAAEQLMLADGRAALGYIAFLSEKIRFLNRKIATFTAGTAAEKLASYILQYASGERFTPPVSYSRIAESLGLGRASLYRAIDELCELGAIRKEQKDIFIIDRGILSRI
ncbi:MAG: Crp/Fnr family transcriptional regulator [Clostridia bacterium]|nr:Crp/Fnr family transcriptional regulator [Clostridia bacterium]